MLHSNCKEFTTNVFSLHFYFILAQASGREQNYSKFVKWYPSMNFGGSFCSGGSGKQDLLFWFCQYHACILKSQYRRRIRVSQSDCYASVYCCFSLFVVCCVTHPVGHRETMDACDLGVCSWTWCVKADPKTHFRAYHVFILRTAYYSWLLLHCYRSSAASDTFSLWRRKRSTRRKRSK